MGKLRVFDQVQFKQSMPHVNLNVRKYLELKLHAEQLGKLIVKDLRKPLFASPEEKKHFVARRLEIGAQCQREERRLLISLVAFLKNHFQFESNALPLTFLQLVCIHFSHQLRLFYREFVKATYDGLEKNEIASVLRYDFDAPYQDYKWVSTPIRKIKEAQKIRFEMSHLVLSLSKIIDDKMITPEKEAFHRGVFQRDKNSMISNFMKHLRQEWHLEPFFEKKYVAYLSDIMSFYCLLILKGTITNQPLYLTYERESERIYESLEREIHLSDARTKPGRYFNFKDTARFYEREFHYDFSYSLRQTREELANLYDSTPKRVSSALYGAHDPRHVFKLQPVPKRHPRFFASAAPSEGGAKTTTLALSLK